MSIVVVGHVDHGKSSVIGRLLADTGSLPEGRLEALRESCGRRGQILEYAYLLDALKEEQAQGVTMDAARCFFSSSLRSYTIMDAPGHVEFLKNMVTGAAHAEAALLIVDATEGVKENSRRHAYMLSMLGIRQVAVLINKMDLVEYDEEVFRRIGDEYSRFLETVGLHGPSFVPVSAREGDNIALGSSRMPWFEGGTALSELDRFRCKPPPVDEPFRMPVQAVYRFSKGGDRRRIIAGTVETGSLKAGDKVVFHPSGHEARVRSLEAFGAPPPREVGPGRPCGFTLDEQIFVRRGEVAAQADQPPPLVTSRLRAEVFWLGREPMRKGRTYRLKAGATAVEAVLESIERAMNAADLSPQKALDAVERHNVAECVLRLERPVAMDRAADIPETGRFVIVDGYEIAGGGLVRDGVGPAEERAPARQASTRTRGDSPPATYPICLVGLGRRRCLVVGGGDVAAFKIRGLLDGGAGRVDVVSPTLAPATLDLLDGERVRHLRRPYEKQDLDGAFIVIAATGDEKTNALVVEEAGALGILAQAVDMPELGSFVAPAVLRRKDLSVAVSTAGAAPALAVRLRDLLERELGGEYGDLVSLAWWLRPAIAENVPCPDARRRLWYEIIDSDILRLLREGKQEAARVMATRLVEEAKEKMSPVSAVPGEAKA